CPLFISTPPTPSQTYTLSLHDALPIFSRHEDHTPLPGRPRAQPLRDDLDRRRRILRPLLECEVLPELRDLLDLRLRRGLQVNGLDRVAGRVGHRASLLPLSR